MQNTLTFITREEYFAWRAEWRTEYAALSASIGAGKRKRSALFKDGKDASTVQTILHRQEKMAFEMMELRSESKKRAALESSRVRLARAPY